MMTECKVPVFVSPQSLTFSLDDKSSYRQIITLFNPYDFPVRFKGKLDYIFIIFPMLLFYLQCY